MLSQGQQRSVVLSLKMAEAAAAARRHHKAAYAKLRHAVTLFLTV